MLSVRLAFRYWLPALCFGLLPTFASAQTNFQIVSVELSPSSIITYSNQSPTLTVSISRPPGLENQNVSVQASCMTWGCGASFIIPAFQTTATGAFTANAVGVQVNDTVVVTIAGGADSKNIPVTLLPNTPTATFDSTSILSPGSTTVHVTLLASLPPGTSGSVAFTVSPSPPAANGGPCPIPAGGSTGSCTVSAPEGTAVPTQVTFTPYLNIGALNGNPTGAPTTITVYPPGEPSLPCPASGCASQAGAPINLTNGDVWVTQRDYSLPGLGGGLSLERTWNSLWSVNRGSQPLAGMFGDSWRSSYEERLASFGSNAIKYYRSNGDAWWFQWNGQNYQLTNPPDQHATLVYNGTTFQYTITFADGTQRIFSGSGYLTTLADRNNNQVGITYDAQNRITQVTDAASRSLTFAYTNASFPALATSATDATGNVATYSYDASGRLSLICPLFPRSRSYDTEPS